MPAGVDDTVDPPGQVEQFTHHLLGPARLGDIRRPIDHPGGHGGQTGFQFGAGRGAAN